MIDSIAFDLRAHGLKIENGRVELGVVGRIPDLRDDSGCGTMVAAKTAMSTTTIRISISEYAVLAEPRLRIGTVFA